MTLFGSMNTAVSGMNGQGNRLGTVSDNIANASTTGYKKSSTAFSDLVMPSVHGGYASGGVETSVRRAISEQGDISYTSSGTDLAIKGAGFFVVSDGNGTPYLTRAGNFRPDASGNLVNAAGFTLMGYPYGSGAPSAVVNGYSGLVPVNVSAADGLVARASTSATLKGNLNSNDEIIDGDLPGDNTGASAYSKKASISTYDSLGNKVVYDVYYAKTADNEWQVSVYRQSDAAEGSAPFPYASGPVATSTMSFDTNGKLVSGGDMSIEDGDRTIALDATGFTQLATKFSASGKSDGQGPSTVQSIQIGTDGVVSARYADGSSRLLYRIPLANVMSPDELTPESGNVYSANNRSGDATVGFADSDGLGGVISGALEESNVDIAKEMVEMIAAQRVYTANTKVFQTGASLLEALSTLGR